MVRTAITSAWRSGCRVCSEGATQAFVGHETVVRVEDMMNHVVTAGLRVES